MRKLVLVFSLCFWGCGKPSSSDRSHTVSVPVDQIAVGRDLAAFRTACTPGLFVRIQNQQVLNLFQFESFKELDAYLERAAKRDPVEALCTPASMLADLCSQQRAETVPWMVYHAQRWVETPGHSRWAEAARAIAYLDYGEKLCDMVWWNEYPPHDQGQGYIAVGRGFLSAIKVDAPAGSLLGYYRAPARRSAQAIFAAVRKDPTEIALYAYLASAIEKEPGQRSRGLKALAHDSPASYALFFTLELRRTHAAIATGKWEWEALQKGFEELLKEHPNALGVRNAYAAAALAYENRPLAAQQAALLGYHWDPDFWGSLDDYQKRLGPGNDHHLDASQLPALELDASTDYQDWLDYSKWQVDCLLKKGLWLALESCLKALPQPDQRIAAGEGLEGAEEEKESAYKAREVLLRNWQQERADSSFVACALGGFFINYAWLARGYGYANSVSSGDWEIFKQRIETASKFLNAPIDDHTDPLVLRHRMTILIAGDFDRTVADRIALLAARRGQEGVPVLESYFLGLLPRWHGEPGDLVKACDQLRKQTGNDDAYYIMSDVAMTYEGPAAVQDPGHPSHIDWRRVLTSYTEAARKKRTTSRWAYALLYNAYRGRQRVGVRSLVPYLPTVAAPIGKEWPVALRGIRDWAEGKADLVAWKQTKLQFSPIGASRQKATAKAEMGIEVRSNKPLMFGSHLMMLIRSPNLTARNGCTYNESAVFGDLFPRAETALRLVFRPGRVEELQPGAYRLELYVDGEPLHSEMFELTD
jgi:hypothetical protein